MSERDPGMQVEDYMILQADSSRVLTRHVRAALQEGWTPQGGVSYGATGGAPWSQAMVRATAGPEFGDRGR
ncbi:MAG TPA: DUF1737 domain-containing protein [Longimicrobium sp.]|nr:DUF1737 domain-containing protein [Longimicrobium sp.]